MKKSIFAVMAFVIAALLVGCSKDGKKSEVAMIVSEVTDSTAMVECKYSPAKSATYQLFVCKAVSQESTKSTRFKISGLHCGKSYEVVAISYNSKHKQVGSSVKKFMTTGVPENKEEVRGIYPPSEDSTVVIFNDEVPDDGK